MSTHQLSHQEAGLEAGHFSAGVQLSKAVYPPVSPRGCLEKAQVATAAYVHCPKCYRRRVYEGFWRQDQEYAGGSSSL